jgi:outer membrane biosynthesis protein TonB
MAAAPAPPPAPIPPVPASGLRAGSALLLSLCVHGLVLGAALGWGVGAPAAGRGRASPPQESPRLAAVLPAREEHVSEPEEEPFELLPPAPAESAAVAEQLPHVDLEPELEPLETEAAPPAPLPSVELLRVRGRRVAPAAAPARTEPPTAPSAASPPEAARDPAPPRAAPAEGSGRSALVARSKPTPTWPAGLPFEREREVGLLFYVRGDGSLAEVRVESPSGLTLLDEHVRAFVARTWAFEPTEQPRWVRVGFRPGASDPRR